MGEKRCKTCHFGKPAGYRQVICKKRNSFQSELYSCDHYVPEDCQLRYTLPESIKHFCGAYPDYNPVTCSAHDCPIVIADLKGDKYGV